jgi:hypothetical protein
MITELTVDAPWQSQGAGQRLRCMARATCLSGRARELSVPRDAGERPTRIHSARPSTDKWSVRSLTTAKHQAAIQAHLIRTADALSAHCSSFTKSTASRTSASFTTSLTQGRIRQYHAYTKFASFLVRSCFLRCWDSSAPSLLPTVQRLNL